LFTLFHKISAIQIRAVSSRGTNG